MKNKTRVKGWQPKADFNLNYNNTYMEELCPKLLEATKRASNYKVLISGMKNQAGIIKSLPINISNFSLMFNQIEIAQRYLTEMVWCLKTMGFHIKIDKIRWHNVMDSCENISGTIGFFTLQFTYKKL